MSTAILIPARLESTRFPNKMLEMMKDKPLIRHVYDKCVATGYPTYVLSDSQQVLDQVPVSCGIMTSSDHQNGTSRCMEVIGDVLKYDRYINVQGDMPDITKEIITAIDSKLRDAGDVATAFTKMSAELQHDPNIVKMIHNNTIAHWFCRASLSYGDHHLGVYGYSAYAKQLYQRCDVYPEEIIESLEQLRWVQNMVPIAVVEVKFDGIEINTPEDLERWHQHSGLTNAITS